MAIASRARRAAAASALVVVAALGVTACTTPETIRTYTPANGANAEVGAVKARGLALVTSGGPALLSGALVTSAEDRLAGVQATAIGADGAMGQPLTVTAKPMGVPAGALVQLPGQGILVDGKGLTPGLTAQVTLTFEKAGVLRAVVPVVSTDHPDWAQMTPKPGDVAKSAASATPSATPRATASPTAASTPTASTTPAGSPTPSASPSR